MNSPNRTGIPVGKTREQIVAAAATSALHKRGFPPGTSRWTKKALHDQVKRKALRSIKPGFPSGSGQVPVVGNVPARQASPLISYAGPLHPAALVQLATRRARRQKKA